MISETELSPAGIVARLLTKYAAEIHPVIDEDLNGPHVVKLDFSENNNLLTLENLIDTARFDSVVNQLLADSNATIGIGGYLENRVIYRRSSHFDTTVEPRSIHLGVDIWAPAGMNVY